MIRLATVEDYDQVKELAIKFHNESPYTDMEFSEYKFKLLFDNNFVDATKSLIVLSGEESHIIGVLAAVKIDIPLYEKTMTTEIIWYVDPTKRKSKQSLHLLKTYEYWSKEIAKADYCQMISLVDLDLTKLYERYGYKYKFRYWSRAE